MDNATFFVMDIIGDDGALLAFTTADMNTVKPMIEKLNNLNLGSQEGEIALENISYWMTVIANFKQSGVANLVCDMLNERYGDWKY